MDDIRATKCAIRYDSRLVYMKKIKADIYRNIGYYILGVDMNGRNSKIKSTFSILWMINYQQMNGLPYSQIMGSLALSSAGMDSNDKLCLSIIRDSKLNRFLT